MEKDNGIDNEATRQAKRQALESRTLTRMVVDTEPCAYGFIDGPEPPDVPKGTSWFTQAKSPFRPHYIWAWGAPGAALTSVFLQESEQLVYPMALPVEALERLAVSPSDFARFLGDAGQRVIEPSDRSDGGRSAIVFLEGAVLSPALDPLNQIRPSYMLPAVNVGGVIRIGYRGLMRGVVLVGEQIP